MKVTIFGASGGIGKYAFEHALKKGYEVTAYVRDSNNLSISHKSLYICEGEINDYSSIKKAIIGSDAVIWCIGIPMKKYTGTPSLDGHRLLLKAMNECKITRLIEWATPSVPFEKDKKSFITIVPGILAGIALKQAKNEMISIGNLISDSNLDWTVVRFMAPKNTPYTSSIKVGFGDTKMSFNISREDIATFMVEQIESKQYLHSMPIIGS